MEKETDIDDEQKSAVITAAELNDTADSMERLADKEKQAADAVVAGMDIKEADYPKIRQTVHDFVSNYAHKDDKTTDEQFLVKQFNKYPELWRDKEEISQIANAIVDTAYTYEKNRRELDEHIAQGKRRESWLARKIEQGAEAAGAMQSGIYAQRIDSTIESANEAMAQTIRNLDGSINQNPNLDGLIAEQHHASTFNIDAATKEKDYFAETLQSNGKNSVDVVVRNERGEIVRKYQSKCGKDAETTESYFEKGDYRGQRKLVPEGQGDKIKGANEKIEFTDKTETIESKPLSKEEAKEKQEQAQREGKIDEYTWNDANKGAIAKKIGRKAGLAALFAIGFQAARIVGRRIWNCVTGKENKSVAEDVKEFAESAIKSGASAGITVAVSGALTVAARSRWLGKRLMKTPARHISAAVCVGIENMKVLYRYGKGELTGAEALDQAGRATTSVIGGFILGTEGAAAGAAFGSVLGPVGATVGGLAGGIVGGIAGSAVGDTVFSAGKKLVAGVANAVRKFATGFAKAVDTVKSVVSSIIPNILVG